MPQQHGTSSSRRDFLKTGTAAGIAGTLLTNFGASAGAFAAGDETLRIGLVGCGGRGTGAANQALRADPDTKLVALGDAFPESIASSLKSLKAQKEIAERVVVDDEHMFVGLDAYRYVVDSCDVVILASPPGFRPEHLDYATQKGKHVFTEKPMATDAVGVQSVIESVRRAQSNNTAMVAGFCWRYDSPLRALFEKIHEGAIGEVLTVYGTYLTTPVKPMPDASTRPEGMTDLEWMVRNWYNFAWLSGDGLVEQACHTVDWLAWAKGDVPPESCTAVGGRQIPSRGGDIYDHIEVNYAWDDGTRGFLAQRQMVGCHNENHCYILGSKGQGTITRRRVSISGAEDWQYKGDKPNMYQVEHDEMFRSIREGRPVNDGDRMVSSTLMAIMGRNAAYTGQQVTWEMIMNSKEKLVPETPDWDAPVPFRPVPLPGVTQFE